MREKEQGNYKELIETTESIAAKYANMVEDRIDDVKNGLTGVDLKDVYECIQILGHIVATLERLSRMKNLV